MFSSAAAASAFVWLVPAAARRKRESGEPCEVTRGEGSWRLHVRGRAPGSETKAIGDQVVAISGTRKFRVAAASWKVKDVPVPHQPGRNPIRSGHSPEERRVAASAALLRPFLASAAQHVQVVVASPPSRFRLSREW